MITPPSTTREAIIALAPLPVLPEAQGPTALRWFYPRAQFARGALRAMIAESRRTTRHVSYPDTAMRPATSAEFRVSGGGPIVLAGVSGVVRDGTGTPLPIGERLEAANGPVVLTLSSDGEEPCALALESDAAPTVEARLDGEEWAPADPRPGGAIAPHLVGEPVHEVVLVEEDGLYVAPTPLLGRVLIECDSADPRPWLTVGESRAEALAPAEQSEVATDLEAEGPGRWVSVNRLGCSYVRVDGARVRSVRILAGRRSFERRGAFACSDERLTKMWTVGATTLATVMHTLVVDGIKRDRVPWLADNTAAILPNAFSFGDRGIVRDGINALLVSKNGYANGIADYTLSGIVALSLVLEHFNDVEFLREVEADLRLVVAGLVSRADEDGLLRTVKDEDSFPQSGPGAVFLDWGVVVDERRTPTAFQALWFWALTSASAVVAAIGSDPDPAWSECVERLGRTLSRRAWDPSVGAWREYVDSESEPVPLANTLASLAGVPHDGGDDAVLQQILLTRTGTPSMRAWALRAAARSGGVDGARELLVEWWGAMVDAGATTFWEEFCVEGESPTEMYGRPFGKSLCHGWSSGPVDLLPMLILGARPLAPGWAEFTVDPRLAGLEWAAAVIPSAAGDISVVATPSSLEVEVPAGAALVLGNERMTGPGLYSRARNPVGSLTSPTRGNSL